MRPSDIALALFVAAIWGLNFSVIKLGLAMACILTGLLINRFGSGWWRQLQGPVRA